MPSVTVLMYHHIVPRADAHSVTIENFRLHLDWLSSSNYRLLSGKDFLAWREGKLRLDRHAVLLTFDDGWFDNWVYALPLLVKLQIPAIFFVVTGWPGEGLSRSIEEISTWHCPSHTKAMQNVGDVNTRDNSVMRWSELLAARATGLVSLQSHSHSHGEWWQKDAAWPVKLNMMEQDLVRSRKVFAEKTGELPDQLCWPRGQFTLEMVRRAQQLGFRHQFSTLRGGNQPDSARMIRRIHVENRSHEWLAKKIYQYSRPLAGTILGYAHQLAFSRRMLKLWGRQIPRHELVLPYWRLV
jgi:peptidoglycan/xylan/chitin deacetylase (PgdA/CDA1 family)